MDNTSLLAGGQQAGQYVPLQDMHQVYQSVPNDQSGRGQELIRVNTSLINDYKCYDIWLIVMMIFAGISILAGFANLSFIELIGMTFHGFMVYTYYLAHISKKNFDVDNQRTAVNYMRVIFYVGCAYVVLVALAELVAFGELSKHIKEKHFSGKDFGDQFEEFSDDEFEDIEPKHIIRGLAAALILFLIYVIAVAAVLPRYLWKKGEEILNLFERRRELMASMGVGVVGYPLFQV